LRSSTVNGDNVYFGWSLLHMPTAIVGNLDGGTVSEADLKDDDRWLLAKRITESKTFAKSERLSQLLLYLCERCLLGRVTELTEQHIAYSVFERKGRFDPAADTIVRSHMLRLRHKLDTYFEEEKINEQIRITIPRGGYVPAFEDIHEIHSVPAVELPIASAPAQELGVADISQLQRTQRRLVASCAALGTLCVLFIVLLIAGRSGWFQEGIRARSARHQLWTKLFNPASATVLVAADSGLVMLHGTTGQNSTLSEYLSRNFNKELGAIPAARQNEILSLASRRYTSFVDLEFFDRLTHLPEAHSGNYSIRYARDISVNDLKISNVILSGSQDANPWIELFEPQMNFILRNDLPHGVRAFMNRKPQTGEQNVYVCDQLEYGVLAFLPNLSNTGNALIVEGTSVAGTEAISDFLFTDGSLDPFLKKIERKDGSIPHFEILLESRSVSGSASRSQILTYRLH
jgi:hypothetical protein